MKHAAGPIMRYPGIDMDSYKKFLKEILIPEKDLQTRIAELGVEISRDYKDSQHLLLIAILRGAVMFLSDLSRQIKVPHAMDFMAIFILWSRQPQYFGHGAHHNGPEYQYL